MVRQWSRASEPRRRQVLCNAAGSLDRFIRQDRFATTMTMNRELPG